MSTRGSASPSSLWKRQSSQKALYSQTPMWYPGCSNAPSELGDYRQGTSSLDSPSRLQVQTCNGARWAACGDRRDRPVSRHRWVPWMCSHWWLWPWGDHGAYRSKCWSFILQEHVMKDLEWKDFLTRRLEHRLLSWQPSPWREVVSVR